MPALQNKHFKEAIARSSHSGMAVRYQQLSTPLFYRRTIVQALEIDLLPLPEWRIDINAPILAYS